MSNAPYCAIARHGLDQSGIVLIVALVVLALMGLSSIALMRAVDATTAITGNLAFREMAIAPATAAIEDALTTLFDADAGVDRERDSPAQGYYASRQTREDARGVPFVLQAVAPDSASVRTLAPGSAITVRYVTERLCMAAGPATQASCLQVVPYVPGALTEPPTAESAPPYTLYRVTARVDGPQGASAYVQMTLGDSSPPRRISWRALEE